MVVSHSEFYMSLRNSNLYIFLNFKRFYLVIYFQREIREGEKHQCVVASCAPSTGDLAATQPCSLDWESNWRPFDSQASTQSTEPHQPGPNSYFKQLKLDWQHCYFLTKWRQLCSCQFVIPYLSMACDTVCMCVCVQVCVCLVAMTLVLCSSGLLELYR